MARQNPHSKAMAESLSAMSPPGEFLEQEVLVLFNAAAQHYVTPKFYVETKPSTSHVSVVQGFAKGSFGGSSVNRLLATQRCLS